MKTLILEGNPSDDIITLFPNISCLAIRSPSPGLRYHLFCALKGHATRQYSSSCLCDKFHAPRRKPYDSADYHNPTPRFLCEELVWPKMDTFKIEGGIEEYAFTLRDLREFMDCRKRLGAPLKRVFVGGPMAGILGHKIPWIKRKGFLEEGVEIQAWDIDFRLPRF